MVSKRILFVIAVMFVMLASLSFISAGIVWFNGTVKDTNGNPVANVAINLTVRAQDFSIVGYNSTTANGSGWFNLEINWTSGGQQDSWMYETSITNYIGSYCNLRSKSLPAFPSQMLAMLSGTTFYLSPAGTINLTAVNASGSRASFNYQIKDSKLGYPIAEDHSTPNLQQAVLCVPSDKNYTIMLFPFQSMPVTFAWNNFSATQTFNISGNGNGNNISFYNVTSKTLHKQFNLTTQMARVTGQIINSNVASWDSIEVLPNILEGGNTVHTQYGAMPYNLSAMTGPGQSDIVNITSGTYNITLPATVEANNVLIFIAATNTSAGVTTYYGGFRNVSLSYGTSNYDDNFTMYSLLGGLSTITLNVFGGAPTNKNVTTSKQTFTLTNGSGSPMANTGAHVEVSVDYSSLAAAGNNITTTAFTWMADVSQGQAIANFSIPLLSAAGIKEMNVFVNGGPSGGNGQYAPKRKTFNVAQIQANSNISISTFNPGAIDTNLSTNLISMALYLSNSTCDVPNPPASCLLGGNGQTMSSFNPMQAVMGGGKLSFRMGYGGILVHYVNVDMMASGPPDASFDSAATTHAGATGFASAMRFGGQGPTIYDYVLISMPYSDGSGGLKENLPVNMSIPLIYDDNWNVIWNVTANGTNVANLAGNYSHYADKATAWGNLTQQKICGTAAIVVNSMMNETNPCYIDTTNNMIWIRLPHFSGSGPSIAGGSSSNSYTAANSTIFLSPTETSNTYISRNYMLINATSNITGLLNLSVYIYNSTALFNVTNTTDPSLFINISGLPDDVYNFTVNATSTAYSNTSTRFNITIDTTNPGLVLAYPAANANLSFFNITINSTYTDTNLNDTVITVYNNSGATISSVILIEGNNASVNFTTDGRYSVFVTTYDRVGNSNITSRNITIDTTSPTITAISPLNNTNYYTNQTITVVFTSTDTNLVNSWFYNGSGGVNRSFYPTANTTYLSYLLPGRYNVTFYANDSVAHVTTYTLSINITDQQVSNSYLANSSSQSNFTANSTISSIIIPYNSTLQNVTVSNTSQVVSLDLSQLLSNGTVTPQLNFSLINMGAYNYTVYIPQYTNITSGNGTAWNGIINLPTVNASTTFTAPSSGTNIEVVDVGGSISLNLSSPAKITIGGMGGKNAAWSSSSTTLTDIPTICNSGNSTNATIPTNMNITTIRECYLNDVNDLVIWTYHFTLFAAYTPAAAAATTTTTTSSGTATTATPEDLTAGLTKTFSTGDVLTFKFSGQNHLFMLLYTKGNNATIKFSSNTQQATLAVGEERSFDINGDGTKDISVKINSISGITADITLKTVVAAAGTPATTETPAAGNETGIAKTIAETTKKVNAWSLTKKMIVLGILLIVIAIIVLVIISIRKSRADRVREHVKISDFSRR